MNLCDSCRIYKACCRSHKDSGLICLAQDPYTRKDIEWLECRIQGFIGRGMPRDSHELQVLLNKAYRKGNQAAHDAARHTKVLKIDLEDYRSDFHPDKGPL